MPTEILKNAAVEIAVPDAPTEDEVARRVKCCTDQDPTLFPEAVAHLLTPRRRRTIVSVETLASMREAVNKS